MNQSKLESLAESTLDMALGFLTSMFVWMYMVAPVVGVSGKAGQAFWITGIFTVSSLIRRYYTRRFFATMMHHKLHQWVLKLTKTSMYKKIELFIYKWVARCY